MRQKLLFVIACLLCAAICWKSYLVFGGTEFGGGTLAGGQIVTIFLYLSAVALTFKYPTAASLVAIYECYESLPLYLYLVFPRPFRQVWPGQWAVLELPREKFVWNGWWITGIVVTIFLALFCAVHLMRSLVALRAPEGWRQKAYDFWSKLCDLPPKPPAPHSPQSTPTNSTPPPPQTKC